MLAKWSDFNSLTSFYGPDKTEVINIARSYRSTKPIIEFTRRLVPNGERIIPFERSGKVPVLKQVDHYAELHSSISSKVTNFKVMAIKVLRSSVNLLRKVYMHMKLFPASMELNS